MTTNAISSTKNGNQPKRLKASLVLLAKYDLLSTEMHRIGRLDTAGIADRCQR